MVESNAKVPQEDPDSNNAIMQKGGPKDPVSRGANKALEIEREFFDKQSPIAFLKLKEILLTPAEKANQAAYKDLGFPPDQLPQLKFLDDQQLDVSQDSVLLTSYPRSGNTLLRAYLEKVMGLVTGSDCDIEKKLNKELLHMGLNGEGLVDKRLWILKTHYPERYGKTKFYAERCILCVRNPIDCVTSLFNMVCTGSHNKSIENEDYYRFIEHWTEFVEQEITIWKDFHEFWIKAQIPVHIIRFEDIIHSPKSCLGELMKFLLNEEKIEGTLIERYIALAVEEQAPQVYRPRLDSGATNADKFTQKHLDFMFNYAKDLLVNFGYESTYTGQPSKSMPSFIQEFNKEGFRKSLYILKESQDITSIFINYPALLLRKKSMLYPEGRTSYRFKKALRKRVTIVDKAGKKQEQEQ